MHPLLGRRGERLALMSLILRVAFPWIGYFKVALGGVPVSYPFYVFALYFVGSS